MAFAWVLLGTPHQTKPWAVGHTWTFHLHLQLQTTLGPVLTQVSALLQSQNVLLLYTHMCKLRKRNNQKRNARENAGWKLLRNQNWSYGIWFTHARSRYTIQVVYMWVRSPVVSTLQLRLQIPISRENRTC